MPHHLRADEWSQYREGISIGPANRKLNNTKKQKKSKRSADSAAVNSSIESLVDVGFPVAVPLEIPPNARVTVKFDTKESPPGFPFPQLHGSNQEQYDDMGNQSATPFVAGEAVDPSLPREEAGYYWGYSVRIASSLSAVFTESPFEDGYDVSLGTSERGQPLSDVLRPDTLLNGASAGDVAKLPETYSHALVVFGGQAGLEVAVLADEELTFRGVNPTNLHELFDAYVNVCPGQGSRTIRTEEAIWIALAQLRDWASRAASQ
jgi:predicted SPOUT superfamily RNA methylase MTH1